MATSAENEIVTVECSRRVAIFGTFFLYRWDVDGRGGGATGGRRAEGRRIERKARGAPAGASYAAGGRLRRTREPGVIRGLERAPATASGCCLHE